MGMAASQARYLGLTARKTNVEYEGQQINQQRTALANQSANTFNELLALQVPTAPSTQDYTTVQYSYTDGANTETITKMDALTGDPDYNYIVTHNHTADVYTGVETKKSNPQVSLSGTTYKVGGNTLKTYDATDDTLKAEYEQIVTDNPNSQFAKESAANIYYWTSGSDTYFTCKTDMDTCIASSTSTENQSKLNEYEAKSISKKIENTSKAFVEFDSSGRATSVKYEDSSSSYSLSTKTTTDENAYNDAMNQYNYNMQVYEKRIADINAKTEKIQQQDRTLELRLRQLDTEQNALQTEMDAVKKVIEKNIESTFKTFGS
ncbi:MAG: hypothetical protein LKG27_06705 [Clostridiaceae bacterium]|jgi:hypothetical protein|nr:hypothetical protein [Clostridiaceae bacterium]